MNEKELNNYETLEDFDDFNVSILINKDYSKVLVILGYRGIVLEFQLVEFIVLITTLAQAASKIDPSKIDMKSELTRIEEELKKANALIKSEVK